MWTPKVLSWKNAEVKAAGLPAIIEYAIIVDCEHISSSSATKGSKNKVMVASSNKVTGTSTEDFLVHLTFYLVAIRYLHRKK